MTLNILLTDDEVVALAAVLERPWPTGLRTVVSTTDGMRDAGLRGLRSLAVRGLLSGDPTEAPGYVVHPDVASVIDGFVTAELRVGAYVAPAAAPDALAGAAITAAAFGEGWSLDVTTVQGVHAFRRASRLDVLDALAGLAEKTYDGTLLAGVGDPRAHVCVIRHGKGPHDRIIVEPNPTSGLPWDRSPLVDALAAVRA
jgi:hypothetical protein